MKLYTISVKKIKHVKNRITYAYALNDMDLTDENIGTFTLEEEVFYELPDDLEYLSNKVAEQIINGKIVQHKPCSEASLLGDGIDSYIIYIVELLIKERITNNKIPETFSLINSKRILEELSDPEVIKNLIDKNILTKENIENLINKIKKYS